MMESDADRGALSMPLVDPDLEQPAEVLERVTPATRAMMSCDYEALWALPRVAAEEQRQDACVHPRL